MSVDNPAGPAPTWCVHWTPLALVVAGFWLGACSKSQTCERAKIEAGLASITTPSSGVDASRAALNAMFEACPSLHPRVQNHLFRAYSEVDRQGVLLRGADGYWSARDRICADSETWVRSIRQLTGGELASSTYATCQLARFDLLEPGETFLMADYPAFIAYDWMIERGIEKSLARSFTRALMHTTTPDSILEYRCGETSNQVACAQQYRRRGVALPRVDRGSAGRAHDAPNVTLSKQVIEVEGEAAGGFEATHHVFPGLREALRRRGGETLNFATSQEVPAGVLIDAMFTAAQERRFSYSLQVENEYEELASLFIAAPQAWKRRVDVAEPPDATITLDAHGLRITAGETSQPVADVAELGTAVRDVLAASKEAWRVRVEVLPTLPTSRVAAVLAALDSERCRDQHVSQCVALPIALNSVPPLARRQGDWSTLTPIVHSTASRWDQPISEQAKSRLRIQVDEALPAIKICLLNHPPARRRMPDQFALIFGNHENGPAMFVFSGDFERSIPTKCIQQAIGLPALPLAKVNKSYHELMVGIELATD